MAAKISKIFLYLSTVIWLALVALPKLTLAEKVAVTRQEVLDVAKEIHPPGCTDSRTADYCQLATAYDVRGEIRDLLEQGMSKTQVIDQLVQKYGERILAAPTKEGFNLVPWILPAIAILIGSILVAFIIHRWAKKKPNHEEDQNLQPSYTEEDELKVNEELKNWL
ncbi:cytochrome c-type biogenesis protein [Virgibacillus oceani]|uniref:Cytochrome c-type biogenesis protein n=1 Tax=Virgibacillus oceani TaxID=1479511 RepID=A0A917LWB7_9BACI|nr:cytochrome c-type biogenesis protein CcmH [Virgibacillus oceani]GGG61004.1 hypothetical protein GCM10011398_00300 [Virgibacillus oceani]